MSTFKGYVAVSSDTQYVKQFVDEYAALTHGQVDYFRKNLDRPPPLACFLSHVHSDHLQGLESLKAPFIYCSPATRELLLRIEKYPHRMNFAKGILETRKQHYRHLKNLLKTIPLGTPTEIELGPQAQLRVTLFDANHCAGAVMFLIEGGGKAVLYTGDIRSEPWWVNSLVRNPVLIPYTLGDHRLDKVYLDTTFAVKRDPYRVFPSKGEGLRELLAEVAKYPESTIFHMNAWTLGYEDVWVALSTALGSQVHVDKYKMGLYRSLTAISGDGVGSYEGPALCGYKCGNRQQAGCLTGDQNVRLHSCERGTECSGIKSENVVWITPVITRTSTGADVPELGAGGGGGDLDHVNELELNDTAAVGRLINLCSTKIREPHRLAKIVSILSTAMVSDAKTLCFDGRFTAEDDEGNISLLSLTEILSRIAENKDTVPKLINPSRAHGEESQKSPLPTAQQLSRSIRFPYSRHSSYDELCHLVEVLKPKDVYPCTTDFDGWHEDISVKTLFGHLCSGSDFIHDREMIELKDERVASSKRKRKREEISSQDNHQGSSPRNGPESDPEVTLVGTEYAASNHDIPTSLKGKTQGPVTEKLSQGYINDPSTRTHPSRSAPHSHRDQLSVIQKTFENSSTTEEVKSPALQSTVELSSSKTYCCAWLGCPETFSTIGVLRRHVLSKHLIRVTIKGKDAYGCLWHDCPDPKILYFTSEEMWEAHMDEIHYHAEVQRALDHAGDVETGDAKTDSQNSLPTPPGANQDYENPPLLPESARSTTSTQAAPIELSDRASMLDHETDEESSDDIAIDEIADRKLRKQVSTMAHGLDSSLIMARTILLAKGYQPLRELYIDQIDSADHRTKYEPAAYEKGYEEFASKVDRLREILPTADELGCLDALRKHNGSFRKARDEVAMSEQRRMATETDPGDETEVSDDQHVANDDAVDVDDEQAASQFSISSSAFNTQDSTLSPTALTSRIEDRKKAYKAARGLDGYEWAVHSPISAGNSHTEKEVEL